MMVVKQNTLEEAWTTRRPKVSHLKIFGSTTYAQIPNEKRIELDPTSKKLMITLYNNNHKAYKLVDVDNDQLRFSEDVILDEEARPFQTSKIKMKKQWHVAAQDSSIKFQATRPKMREIPSMRILQYLILIIL